MWRVAPQFLTGLFEVRLALTGFIFLIQGTAVVGHPCLAQIFTLTTAPLAEVLFSGRILRLVRL
jgi:hypothetical protein